MDSIHLVDVSMAETEPNFSFYQKECTRFHQQEKDNGRKISENSECQCGRKKKLHTGADAERGKFSLKEVRKHGGGGQIMFGNNTGDCAEFQCLADCKKNEMEKTVSFMLNEWKLGNAEKSQIIISVHGEMVDNFNTDLLRGMANCIVKAVQISQGMVITSGLDWSISKFIGNSVERLQVWEKSTTGQEEPKHELVTPRVSCIGVGCWGGINYQLEMEEHLDDEETMPFNYKLSPSWLRKDSLNAGHTHFLLYSNGTTKRIEEIRLQELTVKLLQAMKKKDNLLPVQILFGSSVPHTVDLFTVCLLRKIPLVLCYGFGGIVDAIAKFVMGKKCGVTDDVNNNRLLGDLKEHLGASEGLKKQKEMLDMYAQNYQDQIVVEVHDINTAGFVNLERTILKAALNGTRQHNTGPEKELAILKIAMEWKVIEVADEFITSSVIQKEDKLVKDELVKKSCLSDQPEFVSAFLKSSDNTLTEVLLVSLYQSIPAKLAKWRQQPIDNLKTIRKCLGKVLGLPEEFLPGFRERGNDQKKLYQSFVVWAILAERWRVANFFLQQICIENMDMVTSSLAAALVCKRVYGKQFDGELHDEYKSKCDHFEKKAISALEHVYLKVNAKPAERWECVKDILEKKWGCLTALDVAMEGDFIKFMACDTIYRWMRLRWTGEEREAPHAVDTVGNGKRFDISPSTKFKIHGICQLLFAVLWFVFSQLDVRAEEYKVMACILFPWTLLHQFGRIRLQWIFRTKKRWRGVIHGNIEAIIYFVVYLALPVFAFISLMLEQFQLARIVYGVVTGIIVFELLLFLKIFRLFAVQLISIEKSIGQIFIFSILIVLLCLAFLPVITGALCLSNGTDIGDISFKLYLFVFSEMSFDVQDDKKCRDGEDIGIFSDVILYSSLAIFLLIGNIMLLNLLVTMITAVGEANKGRADVLWKMSWLRLYIGFRDQTITFAPLNIFEWIIRKCIGCTRRGQYVDQPDGRNDAKQVFNDKIHHQLANKFFFPVVRGEDKDFLGL